MPDEPIVFSSVITNHGDREKPFTYVVLVKNQNNQIQTHKGTFSNNRAWTVITVAQSRIPRVAGTYTVKTFLSNGYMISSPLTDVIEKPINVK